MNPPELATPITSDLAPFATASAGVSLGRPVVTVALGEREFADAAIGGPVAQTECGLGVARLGRVAEEQEVGLRQR